MSEHAAVAYWRQVWRGAFKRQDALDWIENAVGLGLGGWCLWIAFGREGMDDLAKTLIGVGGSVGALGIVGILRLARSAYRIHVDDLARIARIEKERDDERLEVARLQQTGTSKDAITAKARRIVEALSKRIAYAANELANKNKPAPNERRAAWKVEMEKFDSETKSEMERLGCTPLEVQSFWVFTESDLAAIETGKTYGPGYDFYNTRARWVQFRINALRNIVAHYSEIGGLS